MAHKNVKENFTAPRSEKQMSALANATATIANSKGRISAAKPIEKVAKDQ